MEYFAGRDVSMEETRVCILDRDGTVIQEVKGTVYSAGYRSRTGRGAGLSAAVFFAAVVASLTDSESDIGCRGSRSSTGEVP
jgi:hypothetical protein